MTETGSAQDWESRPAALVPEELAEAGFVNVVEIGRGGFGVVYKADEPRLRRVVAIKFLATADLDGPGRMRFERELQAMGTLSSHPNIVTVFGAGYTRSSLPYIVMEWLPRGSLSDRLKREGPMEWREVISIGVKLASGLEAAHRAGVLHRDVKPENVLVSEWWQPKLGDFGIARFQGGHETRSGVVNLSVAHAAPELVGGGRPTVATDVYALGSTLVNLLLARPAFLLDTDESVYPLIYRIKVEPVPDLRPQGVPDEVCKVLERAVAKEASGRPASAEALGRELQTAQQALMIPATPMVLSSGAGGGASDAGATQRIDVNALSGDTMQLPGLPPVKEETDDHGEAMTSSRSAPPVMPSVPTRLETTTPPPVGRSVLPPPPPPTLPPSPLGGRQSNVGGPREALRGAEPEQPAATPWTTAPPLPDSARRASVPGPASFPGEWDNDRHGRPDDPAGVGPEPPPAPVADRPDLPAAASWRVAAAEGNRRPLMIAVVAAALVAIVLAVVVLVPRVFGGSSSSSSTASSTPGSTPHAVAPGQLSSGLLTRADLPLGSGRLLDPSTNHVEDIDPGPATSCPAVDAGGKVGEAAQELALPRQANASEQVALFQPNTAKQFMQRVEAAAKQCAAKPEARFDDYKTFSAPQGADAAVRLTANKTDTIWIQRGDYVVRIEVTFLDAGQRDDHLAPTLAQTAVDKLRKQFG